MSHEATRPAVDWDVPNFSNYFYKVSTVLAILVVFDVIVARHTRARWFAVHVIANLMVVVFSAPSLWLIVADIALAIRTVEYSLWTISAHIAVHVYHLIAFDDLVWLDWLHHGLMLGVFTPLGLVHERVFGCLADAMTFFLCGLPGGLDYALLFCVKHNWMDPLTEKQWNATINTWIRAPGVLLISGISFVAASLKTPNTKAWHLAAFPMLMILILSVWNAQYFSARVVANYHVRLYQAKQRLKK